VINLQEPGAVEKLQSTPFIIKEGTSFRMRAKFRVQHEVISGLRYLQLVKRKGIRVDKTEEMMVCVQLWDSLCLLI
jgi:Rho GDP-dissociation inhibitor